MIVDSSAKYIADTIRDGILRSLFQLNGWDMALLPEVNASVTRDIAESDAVAVLEALNRLAADDPAREHYRSAVGAPQLPEGVVPMVTGQVAPQRRTRRQETAPDAQQGLFNGQEGG